ncbi:MAG: hypothetical protein EXR28_10070 [Betaproteobacteria bacterium]|nr:hypothetical protein [Betaproteobacteria bacterium]
MKKSAYDKIEPYITRDGSEIRELMLKNTGGDTMIVATHYTGPQAPRLFASRGEGQRRGIRRLLSVLPPNLARRIGYKNAERVYRLGK